MSASHPTEPEKQGTPPPPGPVADEAREIAERAKALRDKARQALDAAHDAHMAAEDAHRKVNDVHQARDAQAARAPKRRGQDAGANPPD